MRGLKKIPTSKEIEHAYFNLQYEAEKVTDAQLALWIQWGRLDPRLAQIIVQYLFNHWKKHNPMSLRESLLFQPWPEAFGPLVSFLLKAPSVRKELSQMKLWAALVLNEIKNAPFENYFIGFRSFAGKLLQEDAEKSLAPFLQWGYFSQENLIQDKMNLQNKPPQKTLLKKEQRLKILNSLIQDHSRFTVKDYIRKSNGMISVRQAELDLKNHPGLKKMGRTKGSSYSLSKKNKK